VALLAEAIGVTTGFPFGHYAYTDKLGPQLIGVPLVIPLAWAMMAYPALLAGRRLASPRMSRILISAWALASWDLFLDPQMVDAGQWRWADPSPALPGISGIPVTNFLGWLAVSIILMAILDALLPDRPADDALPATLYLWTYASSVLAAAVFFERPGVALVGGVAMGVVAIPYGYSLWRTRR
jgi:putative membrane protein